MSRQVFNLRWPSWELGLRLVPGICYHIDTQGVNRAFDDCEHPTFCVLNLEPLLHIERARDQKDICKLPPR